MIVTFQWRRLRSKDGLTFTKRNIRGPSDSQVSAGGEVLTYETEEFLKDPYQDEDS